MAMWVFGYGSLIWKAGFNYDDRLVGFIKDYRRVFYQGSTDHRGTPEYPGRTVTLEPADGEVCWGAAYKISKKEDKENAIMHLEVREKQYDKKAYLDFFTDPTATTPAISGVMVYIASPDKKLNKNYLGPASLEEIAKMLLSPYLMFADVLISVLQLLDNSHPLPFLHRKDLAELEAVFEHVNTN
ncbi:ChaC-like family protein isoform 2 [Theobroma cacao]|uniref:glutathione-specific gamma-glutamylcyclotransferase n=1 Tax=Theobroma cacao TaxID=3641 RepID=A0A061FP21_THECC|nr:ChaC-like family protein isoform 2 [Theobroma cacao]